MEGVSNEACSLAGHWGLGKLIAFYDDNHISIDGDTEIAFSEDVNARFEALGWHTIWVKNGNTGYDEIRAAIKEAKAVKDKPTLIKVVSSFFSLYISLCYIRKLHNILCLVVLCCYLISEFRSLRVLLSICRLQLRLVMGHRTRQTLTVYMEVHWVVRKLMLPEKTLDGLTSLSMCLRMFKGLPLLIMYNLH